MAFDPFPARGGLKRLAAAARRRVLLGRRRLMPIRVRGDRSGPPNLLVLAIDTLRHDRLDPAGGPRRLTPALAALAARGVAFGDVTAPAPWTLPSFTSSLTGVMPALHGAGLTGPQRDLDREPPRRYGGAPATLATHLARQGYRTAAFYANPFVGFGLAETFAESRYHNLPAHEVTFLALEWIRRQAGRPFFCFVLLNDPHEPTTPSRARLAPRLADPLYLAAGGAPAPDRARRRALTRWGDPDRGVPHLGRCIPPLDAAARADLALKLALYDACVAAADAAVGGAVDQLAAWGLDRNTLVTVYSDHGEEFLEHLEPSRRWDHDPRGLHGIGHGHAQFQELLHVPWLAAGPGVPAGARVEAPVSLCDVAPTLCDWLGVAPLALPAAAPALAGRSLAPLAAGRAAADPDRLVLAEDIAYGPDLIAARRGRWKLIATRDGRPLALFDLAADPGETRDARAAQPTIVGELLAAAAVLNRSAPPGAAPASGEWENVEDKVRRQLRELGYSD
ncbi:MAG: sulfatase-like hydrolase/transferase [Candidatus Krumholzibacteriia bacterium]